MGLILPKQNRELHILIANLSPAGADFTDWKADLVTKYTNGRTGKSSEMTEAEAQSLIDALRSAFDTKAKPMRGKIIHLLCLMGMVLYNGAADYTRINNFIQKIGARNPRQKKLGQLNLRELLEVLNQVEAMYKNEVNRAS